MINEVHANQLARAAQLAQSDHKPEAAQLCRQIVGEAPDYTTAWLWLAYSSAVQPEVAEALTRAQRLEPTNPAVIQALNWYQNFLKTAREAVPAPTHSPQLQASDWQFTPIGPPVKESSNILMTQSGGILLISLIFLIGGLLNAISLFVLLTGLLPYRKTFSTMETIVNWVYLVVSVAVAILAAITFWRSVQDISTPPVRAIGTIVGQKRLPRNVRNRFGRVMYTDYSFQITFQPDNSHEVVILELSERQYEAAKLHQHAFIIYGRKLKNIRVYQQIA